MIRAPAPRAHTQRGAALAITLMLLMILTVLAISMARTAALELTLATNTQLRENAVQLAHSGLDTLMRRIETDTTTLDVAGNCPAFPAPPRSWSDNELPWNTAVEVTALHGRFQTRLCLAGTTSIVTGTTRYRQLHYLAESWGRTDQRRAEARQARSFYQQVAE